MTTDPASIKLQTENETFARAVEEAAAKAAAEAVQRILASTSQANPTGVATPTSHVDSVPPPGTVYSPSPAYNPEIPFASDVQIESLAPQEPKHDQAVPVPQAVAEEQRKGSKFCGCCCDMRRAVIIVNIVVAVMESIMFILVITGSYNFLQYEGDETIEDLSDRHSMVEAGLSVVSIICTGLAIHGALHFNYIPVLINCIWFGLGWLIMTISAAKTCSDIEEESTYYDSYFGIYYYTECTAAGSIIINFLWSAFFAYPNIMFVVQVKKGIMSRETYPREKAGCCEP